MKSGDETSSELALPGLALSEIPGAVRTVRTPDFAGLTFHEVRARSVLNRVSKNSAVPFSWTVNPYRGCSHACTYCLAGDTEILLPGGRIRALADLRIGDHIYGTTMFDGQRHYVKTQVLAHWSVNKPAFRVTLDNGVQLTSSGDHRYLTDSGWRYVANTSLGVAGGCLQVGDLLMGLDLSTKNLQPADDEPQYRAGYVAGLTAGGGCAEPEVSAKARQCLSEITSFTETVKYSDAPNSLWNKGFCAGIYDAAGARTDKFLRITVSDTPALTALERALHDLKFSYTIKSAAGKSASRKDTSFAVIILGDTAEHIRFFQLTNSAHERKRDIGNDPVRTSAPLRVVAITLLHNEMNLFDITTGTGDFIANGVVSHNCFARNTHTYLDFDAGKDFDSQVVVKINAPEVLRVELNRPQWTRDHVAMGTNTDPYQRAEGRYRLMPKIIDALADSGTPFSILTKGTVLSRDLSLLAAANETVPVRLAVSLALLDREVQQRLEPGTPSPQARLDLVRKIREAGLICSVLIAPVLPALTDSTHQLDELFAALAEVDASAVTVLPLHLRPGTREWFMAWLEIERPDLVATYHQLYRRGSYVSKEYRHWLSDRVAPLYRRHRLTSRVSDLTKRWWRGPASTDERAKTVPVGEQVTQLSLL